MHTQYQHGGDIYSNKVSMDYSANINPLGLPQGVKEELARCMKEQVCCVYPDSRCTDLVNALADYHKVSCDWIICGNGAADLIFGLTFALKPEKALLLAPSFLEYEQALKAVGCDISLFYLKEENGYCLDVDELCQIVEKNSFDPVSADPAKISCLEKDRPVSAALKGWDILFLCNPNNPTGIAVKKEQVLKLAETCERTNTFLVVDECFGEFLDEPEAYSVIPFLEKLPHVFVLKAFTKIYAMAGMRLGYALCSSGEVLTRISQVRQPWSVSGLAQKAGIAALKETEYVLKTRKLIHEQRNKMEAALEKLGYIVYPSQANYIFFRERILQEAAVKSTEQEKKTGQEQKNAGKETAGLYDRMLKQGVLIRSCSNYPGLDASCYRICVKTEEENREFLHKLSKCTVSGRT